MKVNRLRVARRMVKTSSALLSLPHQLLTPAAAAAGGWDSGVLWTVSIQPCSARRMVLWRRTTTRRSAKIDNVRLLPGPSRSWDPTRDAHYHWPAERIQSCLPCIVLQPESTQLLASRHSHVPAAANKR